MATIAFGTYKAVQDLKGVGLDERQAAALVGAIRWAVTGEYTSYADCFSELGDGGVAGCEDVVMRSVAADS